MIQCTGMRTATNMSRNSKSAQSMSIGCHSSKICIVMEG